MANQETSGVLCDAALRAFDRLCSIERTRTDGGDGQLTPRQAHRRRLLESRAHASEWIVPAPLAETVHALIDTANGIVDPALAFVWADHLPVAVLACLERRSLARRIAEGDAILSLNGAR
jgi:hypothetical protein